MTDANRPGRADILKSLSVDRLKRGRLQPRQAIDGPALARLAKSVQSEGVIQPLFVRRVTAGTFEILAGERRWHAAKMAGLRRVPTVVRDVSDATALAISLVENLHREELNPIDQATAIARLVVEFSMTHAEVAETIGRSRATVSNLLRLLELPASVRTMIATGRLDAGHARAILSLPQAEQTAMAEAAEGERLSVREVERRVHARKAALAEQPATTEPARPEVSDDLPARAAGDRSDLDWLGADVERRLGRRCSVRRRRDGHWRLDIGFSSLDELAGALATVLQLIEDQSQD